MYEFLDSRKSAATADHGVTLAAMTHESFSRLARLLAPLAVLATTMAACGGGAAVVTGTDPSELVTTTTVAAPASDSVPSASSPVSEVGAEAVDGTDPSDGPARSVDVVGVEVQAPTAPAPGPGPTVELEAVEAFAPAAVPGRAPVAPTPVSVLGTISAPGGLTSNTPGCASSCITAATVSFETGSTRIGVEVASNVPARFDLYISTTTPTIGPDGPTMPGVDPIRNGRLTRSWSRSISGLGPNAEHYVVLRATDRNGATQVAVGSFRTVNPLDPADDLAPAPSCAFQCISSGVVRPGVSYDTVRLEVRTTVAANLKVALSTQPPEIVGGVPSVTPEVAVFVPTGLATSWDLDVAPLAADTVYHAVVSATDAQGRTTRRVGSFRTGEAPPIAFRAQVNRVTVDYDGDPGVLNDGELSFAWGYRNADGLQLRGHRPQAKMSDGDTFETAPHSGFVGSVRADGEIPSIALTVHDLDRDGLTFEYCPIGFFGVSTGQTYNDGCDMRSSGAETGALTPNEVMELRRCSTFGFIGELEDAYCLLLDTGYHGENYARAWTIVSYELS